jgi:hypothetical protein
MTGSVGTATLNTPAIFVLLALALAAAYYGLSKDLIVDSLAAGTAQDDPVYQSLVEHAEPVLAAPVVLVPVAGSEPAVDKSEQVVVDLRRESTG